jgi:hypothetical protein
MEEKRSRIMLLPIIGGVLILLNILLSSIFGTSATISSSSASVEDLTTSYAPLWGRITVGFSNYAGGNLPAIGIVLAAIIVYFSLILYLRPRFETTLSLVIMVFSGITLFYGGGFFIGSILAFIGAAAAFQTPLEFGKTIVGKMLASLRASPNVFQRLAEEASVREAAIVILFVNLLSGIGNAIYLFNADGLINTPSSATAFEAMLNGRMNIDMSVIPAPITLMGLGIIKWMVLSLLIFIVGVKFFEGSTNLATIATVTGFAYAPICLQVFTPFVFTSTPYLLTWPMAVFYITNLWMFLILVAGMQHVLNVSLMKSLALVALCGAIYTLIDNMVFLPMYDTYVPKFQIQPPEVMLLIASFFIIVALFFVGTKERR